MGLDILDHYTTLHLPAAICHLERPQLEIRTSDLVRYSRAQS
jgi:hypothetical protein